MKNKKALFSQKTKELIYERDSKCCFKCWVNSSLQFHHIYYSNQAIYWKERNNIEMGVTVCMAHHLEMHWCKMWTWLREEAILYVKNLYERE